HRRSDLGDVTRYPDDSETETLADFIRETIEDREGEGAADGAIAMPLWLYEHSGMTMRASKENLLADGVSVSNPFSCPWDSGMVGFIYMTRETMDREWSRRDDPRDRRADAMDCMAAEVETYDMWLRGEVYGYIVADPDGNEHSCWGVLGDLNDYVMAEAMSIAVPMDEAYGAARAAAEAEDLTRGTPM